MKKCILMIVVTTVCLTILTGCGDSDDVDLNQYLTLSYTGADGDGRVDDHFDTSRFVDENAEKVKYSSSAAKSYGAESPIFEELGQRDIAEFVAMEYIDYDIEPDDDLSNGDTVKVTWNCSDEMIKKVFGLELKHEDFSDTVSGLGESSGSSKDSTSDSGMAEAAEASVELEEVDPFDTLEVIFNGSDGSGEAKIGSSHFDGVNFEIFPKSGLSNGETIKVSVKADDPFFKNHEMKPSVTEKEFTVEGLVSYKLQDTEAIKDQIFKAASEEALADYKEAQDYDFIHDKYIKESNGWWDLNKECTESEARLKALYAGNVKDPSSIKKNVILAVIEFPYKISISGARLDSQLKRVGDVIGEGLILYEVQRLKSKETVLN